MYLSDGTLETTSAKNKGDRNYCAPFLMPSLPFLVGHLQPPREESVMFCFAEGARPENFHPPTDLDPSLALGRAERYDGRRE